ncbi:MAG: thiol peroxidase [Flavobacteriales bacterium]|nr:thiol peroxidase [Flavobacteriales bacterium]MBP7154643.1 thiol peroxidase [Flavobacteriales bacterium]HQV76652.1 thiol peroxidase [Flavobacteriales bacterium]
MPLPKLNGVIPQVGQAAPTFRYVATDKTNHALDGLKGEVVIVLAFPSVDTPTCAIETRTFNQHAADLGATILVASMDLPFAMKRFCAAEGIDKVKMASDFRYRDMWNNWGVAIAEGGLEGTLARAVWVLDKNGMIQYHELVPEIGSEPNYVAALSAAKALL